MLAFCLIPPLVSSMNVLYIGGINSSGAKAAQLQWEGYKVTNPKLPNRNITAGLARVLPNCMKSVTGCHSYLKELQDSVMSQVKDKPDLVIGSSQGGAVAMSLQDKFPGARYILIAPAWNTFGVEPVVPDGAVVLHGTKDWIVPLRDSEYLKRKNNCELIKVRDTHHLPKSFGVLLDEVEDVSVSLGKHKPYSVIRKEWKDYVQARKAWEKAILQISRLWYYLNCTNEGIAREGVTDER